MVNTIVLTATITQLSSKQSVLTTLKKKQELVESNNDIQKQFVFENGFLCYWNEKEYKTINVKVCQGCYNLPRYCRCPKIFA